MKWSDRNLPITLAELPKCKLPVVDSGMAWTTKDGKLITIAEMADTHLSNCIKLLTRKGAEAKLKLELRQSVHTVTQTMFPIYAQMVVEMRRRLDKASKTQPTQLLLLHGRRKFRL